jgi:quercetin dioxygenase-like cupin family protein
VLVCPPGEKYWHGATATTGMSHIAIQEALDGKVVDWLESAMRSIWPEPPPISTH